MNELKGAGESLKEEFLREQVRLGFKQLPIMQSASFVVALVLAFLVRRDISFSVILSWLLMVLTLVAGRIIIYYRFMRVSEKPFSGKAWSRAYLLLTFISGLVWGSSAFFILPIDDLKFVSLFVLVIASLSASTTISHSSLKSAPALWSAPALLSYAVRCFMEGGEFAGTIGFLIFLYLFTVLHLTGKHHHSVISSISLKFDNLKLLNELRQTNEMLTRDIAERKKAEERLRTLSRSVEQSPVSIVITDTKGTIEYVNPKFTERTGYTYEEAIGKNPRILKSGKTEPEMYEQLWKTISSGKVWHGEICNKKKSGDLYWESATIAPVSDDAGAVIHYVSIKQDITEIKEAHEALNKANQLLEVQATTDSLTGISNRFKFDEMLMKELSRSKRYNLPLSLVMFDIDHFKKINDTFGHHTGDVVLKELTAHIAKNIRKHDYFARWGGEEFMILLTHTTLEPAVQFAENCRIQTEELKIGGLEGLTCSFGVTELNDDDNIFSFTKRVDDALYKAKTGGRNRVEAL